MSVTAILLAAGYATRLYPLTKDTPKALLPLGEGVILDHIVRELGRGLTKQILVTNRRFAEAFRRWQQARQIPLDVIDDGTESPEARLGAIRDLELARTQGRAQGDLLVLGTDNLFSWSLQDFVSQAQRHAPHASVALWQAPSTQAATQFGVVTLDGSGRITSFVEKSPRPPSTAVAMCIYYFPEAMCGMIRRFLDEGQHADAPGYFIAWLVDRSPVYGILMPGEWHDIGTIEAYEAVCRTWKPRPDAARIGGHR